MSELDGTTRPLFTNADLRRLIIPLVIEQLLICTVGMADTMMVSCLGETKVAGVTLIDSLNNAIYHCFGALATGGAVVAAQYLGARKERDARGSALQLLFVNLGIASLVMCFCLACGDDIMRVLFGEDLRPEIAHESRTYFRITALSYPFFAIFTSCAALLRSQNKSNLSLYSSVVSNIVNVSGNALLIHVLGWGVAGAATATLAARIVAMLLLLYFLFDARNVIHISLKERWRIDFACIRRILNIGIPSAIEGGIFQFGRVIVVSVISVFGASQLAANAVANNIDYFGCLVGSAFCLSMITVIGQAVGRGDEQLVRFYVRKMMKLGCISHVVWSMLVLSLSPVFLHFYTLTDETYWLVVKLILIHNGLGMVLWMWSFAFPNALRAANDVKFVMVWSVMSMICVRVGVSHLLGGIHFLGWGALGVWIAMVLDWIVRIIGCVYRYRSGKWVKYMHQK